MKPILVNNLSREELESYKKANGFDRCYHPNIKESSIGRCLAQYDCPDCGFSYIVDSSD